MAVIRGGPWFPAEKWTNRLPIITGARPSCAPGKFPRSKRGRGVYRAAPESVCPMTPALSISHLRKVYDGKMVAVDDLSLTINPGDFFGFLGPNGAGKSTTIHCMTGIAKPTSGKIEIFGVDAVKDYREARRGFRFFQKIGREHV